MSSTFQDELKAAQVRLVALQLADAEHALNALSKGVDAIVDTAGNTHLLRGAQQHLRRNEARLQAILESIPDVVMLLNRSGEVRYQSPSLTPVLGYDSGEQFGSSIFGWIHPEDLTGFKRAFFAVDGKVCPSATTSFRHRTRDGSWCLLEGTFAATHPSMEPGIILIYRKTHHRGQNGDQKWAGDDRHNPWLAILAHELRIPLTPALLGIQELEDDERFAGAKPMLAMIRRNIELEARLITELLDFTRIIHGKLRPNVEMIDAHVAVHEVLEICRSEIASRSIQVQLNLKADGKDVGADPLELRQILWNLVRNAVQFSLPGGLLEIASANNTQGDFLLDVVDHGIGITPTLLPLVFNSFQQGNGKTQHDHGGLGLGLFIAKNLAEAQHGSLVASSGGPGKGSTFRLTLKTSITVPAPEQSPVPDFQESSVSRTVWQIAENLR